MKQVLFASTNKGKLHEMREIASRFGFEVINPADLVANYGAIPDVEEGIVSYHENALKKAKAFFDWSGLPCLADDTGLEVRALNGAPGVTSARFAGDNATMTENKALLLEKLKDAPDRSANFRCILCYMSPGIPPAYSEGTLKGSIGVSESGEGGFGYDSLFIVGDTGQSLSHLKAMQRVDTHRYRAFEALVSKLNC